MYGIPQNILLVIMVKVSGKESLPWACADVLKVTQYESWFLFKNQKVLHRKKLT